MSVITGTIKSVSLLSATMNGLGTRKCYLVTADFAAYASTDTAQLTGVGAAIALSTKNGKTNTLRGAIPVQPGLDTNAQAIYFTGTAVQAATVSTDALTGQLSAADLTEITTATASTGVAIAVIVDES